MLEIRPVTADRWEDLAALFGPSGAFSHCWCTWWRQTSADFSQGVEDEGAANRALMHDDRRGRLRAGAARLPRRQAGGLDQRRAAPTVRPHPSLATHRPRPRGGSRRARLVDRLLLDPAHGTRQGRRQRAAEGRRRTCAGTRRAGPGGISGGHGRWAAAGAEPVHRAPWRCSSVPASTRSNGREARSWSCGCGSSG